MSDREGEISVLLEHIDEPGLATIDVFERLGGYEAARKALTEMEPADGRRGA